MWQCTMLSAGPRFSDPVFWGSRRDGIQQAARGLVVRMREISHEMGQLRRGSERDVTVARPRRHDAAFTLDAA